MQAANIRGRTLQMCRHMLITKPALIFDIAAVKTKGRTLHRVKAHAHHNHETGLNFDIKAAKTRGRTLHKVKAHAAAHHNHAT